MRAGTSRRAQRALRLAALEYAERGWEVAPGTYLLSRRHARRGDSAPAHRCSCRQPGCPAPGAHPVDPDWAAQATNRLAAVEWWWSSRPHGIVLPLGTSFEVFDVPGRVGSLALRLMRSGGVRVGPVSRTPDGRWQFLSSLSGQSCWDYLESHGVRHRGAGEYLLAPPTRTGPAGGPVWLCPPSPANRRLADAASVAAAIEKACTAQRVRVPADTRPAGSLLGLAHIR